MKGNNAKGNEDNGNGKLSYEKVALICDQCQQRVCVQTCCHHLQIGSYNERGQFYCKNKLPVTFEPPKWRPKFDGNEANYILIHRKV